MTDDVTLVPAAPMPAPTTSASITTVAKCAPLPTAGVAPAVLVGSDGTSEYRDLKAGIVLLTTEERGEEGQQTQDKYFFLGGKGRRGKSVLN